MKVKEFYRVLIVDDERLIRKGIVHYLDWEQEGFMIVGEAANGHEALELIEKVQPNIIVTDIVMPIMDGEELTRIVKKRYPDIAIIILSSYSEFDYVRSTFQNGVVDYILKPKLDAQSLLKGLKSAASSISLPKTTGEHTDEHPTVEQIIDKLLAGYEAAVDEEFLAKTFPYRYFYLLGANLKDGITIEKIEEELRFNIGDGVFYSFTLNKKLCVIVINIEKNKTDFISQMASLESGIGFVLTEAFSDFMQIGKVYKESLLKLLDYRFYLSELPLVTMESLPKQVPQCEKFNLEWFTEELKRKYFDSAFAYLKEHVTRLSACFTTDIFEYKAFFSNIIFNITILLSNMGYDVKELEAGKYVYFKSFDEAETAQEAVRVLEDFIGEAKKCLSASQYKQDNVNIKKLVEYMQEHYAEPLTLTGMAKHFHFNQSYLSSYFSTHMNESFTEYLNKLRIEEAAKLLLEGTASISEISGMVGYSDHSYFCKVFKKVKGLSPSQYKRKYT